MGIWDRLDTELSCALYLNQEETRMLTLSQLSFNGIPGLEEAHNAVKIVIKC